MATPLRSWVEIPDPRDAAVGGNANQWDLIVGSPYESVGTTDQAGIITVIQDVSIPVSTSTTQMWTEAQLGFADGVEAYDRFGFSLAYRASGGVGYLAVGVPYENIGSIQDAGVAYLFTSQGTSLNPVTVVHQDVPGLLGMAQAGDNFGASVALAGSGVTGSDVHLAVGIPYEDVGPGDTIKDAGAVQVFPVNHLTNDALYTQESPGIAGDPAPQELMGLALANASTASEGVLLVSVPWDTVHGGMVQVIPYRGGPPRIWTHGQGAVPIGWGVAANGD